MCRLQNGASSGNETPVRVCAGGAKIRVRQKNGGGRRINALRLATRALLRRASSRRRACNRNRGAGLLRALRRADARAHETTPRTRDERPTCVSHCGHADRNSAQAQYGCDLRMRLHKAPQHDRRRPTSLTGPDDPAKAVKVTRRNEPFGVSCKTPAHGSLQPGELAAESNRENFGGKAGDARRRTRQPKRDTTTAHIQAFR